MITPMQLESADPRRMIWEAKTTGGERFTMLTIAGGNGPLGNHAHQRDELFILVGGDGELYTRSVNEAGDAIGPTEKVNVVAPCIIEVPAYTAHTFIFAGPAKMLSRMIGNFEEAGWIQNILVDPATGKVVE